MFCNFQYNKLNQFSQLLSQWAAILAIFLVPGRLSPMNVMTGLKVVTKIKVVALKTNF